MSRVSHTFSTNGQGVVQVLSDITLGVDDGEFVAIVGPSGCGKTTLLKLVAGLLRPSGGRICIDGETPTAVRERAKLSFMFQSANLLSWRTVSENIALPLEISGVSGRSEIEALIQLVKLEGFGDSFPRELSGGMRSRVALARSIIVSPSLLLLDEPFGALDEETSRDLNLQLLTIWRAKRPTVLLVTHNIEHAVFVAQRIVVLSHRPARIKTIIDISLPEPRTGCTRFAQEYFDGVTSVRHALEGRHNGE